MVIQVSALELSSNSFRNGKRIPAKYTADGDNMSPSVYWSSAPPETSEFALICDDPDAIGGTFTHWAIYSIPAPYEGLHDGVPQVQELDNLVMQGLNSAGKIGYTGPAPPPGKVHHYRFHVYALDARLGLPAGITKMELLAAMRGHVIAEGEIVGLYGR